MPKLKDIKQFTQDGNYEVNVPLDFLAEKIDEWVDDYGLIMVPDFQRGHVWNEAQQIAFVEYFLRGGKTGTILYFNCPWWDTMNKEDCKGYSEFTVVDGLQRITALLRFVRGELPVFGYKLGEYEDRLRMARSGDNLRFNVNCLKNKADVLQWYIDMNTGGVVHTDEEIEKVRVLLEEENRK